MDHVEEVELKKHHLRILSTARALTLAQYAVAGELADQLMLSQEDVPAIAQTLATNYLAEATREHS